MLQRVLPKVALQRVFDLLAVPPYQAGVLGPWRLARMHGPVQKHALGYFSAQLPPPKEIWVLSGDDKVQRRLTPLELESQAHHAAAAFGHTAILGLGTGALLFNVLAKANVDKVTLVEQDCELVRVLEVLGGLRTWPGVEKLVVETADARQWRVLQPVDVCLVDIWSTLGEASIRSDALSIRTHVPAGAYGFRGIELDFIAWLSSAGTMRFSVTDEHFHDYAAFMGIPLIGQNIPDFGRMCNSRTLRRLPMRE